MVNGPQAKSIAVAESRSGRAFYGFARFVITQILYRYFRLIHRGREHLETPGPLILAPVHRSNLDAPLIAALASRRTKSLSKASLFESAPVAWLISALGGFPVDRGAADRDALRAAQDLLESGASMIVFPEGTRQTGEEVAEVYDGAAFLASRTGAHVVPIGIAGTENAMPSGVRFPRRSKVAIVVGEPMAPPVAAGKRVSLSQRRAYTADLQRRLQGVFDEAVMESEQV
jgi:1-acyl-sn-glycerol-3-phosphate acyltransferase